MKELNFIKIINETLNDTSFLGNDCALLQEGLYVTQDNLVENIHFDLNTITPKQLGHKAVAVNLSDLAAALAEPRYITIGFCAPNNIDEKFVKEFYQGVNEICTQFGVKVIGGDITGGSELNLSITAIGKKKSSFNVSRSFAQVDDVVCTVGEHGLSSCGLFLLTQNDTSFPDLIRAHLEPVPQVFTGLELAQKINTSIATMDTSDGLADALFKIATMSKKTIEIDFSLVKTSSLLKEIAKKYDKNFEDWILWGGEDYGLVVCLPIDVYEKCNKNVFNKIGIIKEKLTQPLFIKNCSSCNIISEELFYKKSFNHFEKY